MNQWHLWLGWEVFLRKIKNRDSSQMCIIILCGYKNTLLFSVVTHYKDSTFKNCQFVLSYVYFFFLFLNGENMKQEFLHVTKLKQEKQLLFPNEIFYFLSLLFINFPTSFYSDLNFSSFPWTQLEQKMFRLIFFLIIVYLWCERHFSMSWIMIKDHRDLYCHGTFILDMEWGQIRRGKINNLK